MLSKQLDWVRLPDGASMDLIQLLHMPPEDDDWIKRGDIAIVDYTRATKIEKYIVPTTTGLDEESRVIILSKIRLVETGDSVSYRCVYVGPTDSDNLCFTLMRTKFLRKAGLAEFGQTPPT